MGPRRPLLPAGTSGCTVPFGTGSSCPACGERKPAQGHRWRVGRPCSPRPVLRVDCVRRGNLQVTGRLDKGWWRGRDSGTRGTHELSS